MNMRTTALPTWAAPFVLSGAAVMDWHEGLATAKQTAQKIVATLDQDHACAVTDLDCVALGIAIGCCVADRPNPEAAITAILAVARGKIAEYNLSSRALITDTD